jgi:hypothetical protein
VESTKKIEETIRDTAHEKKSLQSAPRISMFNILLGRGMRGVSKTTPEDPAIDHPRNMKYTAPRIHNPAQR